MSASAASPRPPADKPAGVWGAVLLPIRADESIDFDLLREEIEILAAAGLAGLYSNGTAGEFFAQTEAEFDRVQACLAEVCGARGLPFQIGAGHPCAQTMRGRVRRSQALQPAAFQVILPDWVPVSNEEGIRFLRGMAETADGIPLVLYNPGHAKRVLGPADFAELADAVPELIGLKCGGGDADWFAAMRPLLDRLSVFVPGHRLATGLAQGAHGSYSNIAALHPAGAQAWFEQMHTDPAAARELETRILAFFENHIFPLLRDRAYGDHALDKLLAAIGGWAAVGTRVRWPYNGFAPEVAENLRPIARRELPELFQSPLAANT